LRRGCGRHGGRRGRCARLGAVCKRCGESKAGERWCVEEEEEVLGGGQILQMMTSFELPERRGRQGRLIAKGVLA